MAKITRDDVLNYLETANMLEISDLIKDIEGISQKVIKILTENKIKSIDDFKSNEEDVIGLKGIGPKTIEKIKGQILAE